MVKADGPECVTYCSIANVDPGAKLTFTAPDGRSATIDFGGGKVTYSGELSVDESGRMFFDALPLLCAKIAREKKEAGG